MSLIREIPENMRMILKYHRLKVNGKFTQPLVQSPEDITIPKTRKKYQKIKKNKYSLPYTQYLLSRIDDEKNTPISILLIFFSESNININEILDALKASTITKYPKESESKPESDEEFLDIIVLLNATTPPALRALKESVNEINSKKKHYISIIFQHQIAWDKSKSDYMQHYELMTKEQGEKFLKENMLKDIPKMYTTDMAAILYGFKLGDIVHALESNSYRMVVTETLEPQNNV